MHEDFPVRFLPNPKKAGSASHKRYDKYMHAKTLREALRLGAKGTSENFTNSDIAWDYSRGYIIFPKHESSEVAAYAHASIFHDPEKSGELRAFYAIDTAKYHQPPGAFHSYIQHLFPDEEPIDFLQSTYAMKQFSAEEHFKVLLCAAEGVLPADLKEYKVPKNATQALGGPLGELWQAAMQKEMDGLRDLGTFELIDDTDARAEYDAAMNTSVTQKSSKKPFKPLPCTWVFRIKEDKLGNAYKLKARICVRGDLAIEGLHYNDIFSPTVSFESVRTLLSVATAKNMDVFQLDVMQAFLNAEVPEGPPIYLQIPHGCQATVGQDGKKQLLKLHRMLYGLPNSPKAWTDLFDKTVLTPRQYLGQPFQMKQLDSDLCVYACTIGGDQILCSYYVDDVLICSTSVALREWFVDQLGTTFPINKNESGPAEWLLGMKIDIRRNEKQDIVSISLTQQAHIERLATQVIPNIEHHNGRTKTPLSVIKLPKLDAPEPGIDPEICMNGHSYRSIVGSCLWLSLCTRPDISYAISVLARHANAPGKVHADQLLRVVKYLYATKDLGLTYHRPRFAEEKGLIYAYQSAMHPSELSATDPSDLLHVYCDADFAGNYDLKSTSGYFVSLHGAPIVWSSKLQSITAQSTAESEVIAAHSAVKEVAHARTLLEDLGYNSVTCKPTKIFEDNASCTAMANKKKSRKNAKHFVRRLRYLNEQVKAMQVEFIQTPSKDQLADMLTKPLPADQFCRLRNLMMNISSDSQLSDEVGNGGGVERKRVSSSSPQLQLALQSAANADTVAPPPAASALPSKSTARKKQRQKQSQNRSQSANRGGNRCTHDAAVSMYAMEDASGAENVSQTTALLAHFDQELNSLFDIDNLVDTFAIKAKTIYRPPRSVQVAASHK